MLAGAIQLRLKAGGLTPVNVAQFSDYTATTAWAVAAFPDRDAELSGGAYRARVQIRARAADIIAAENAGRAAMNILLAADGATLLWDDPKTPPTDRSYKVEAISIQNRPTWYPTPEAGEEVSANFSLLVTEV